jgi:hypothetical protein
MARMKLTARKHNCVPPCRNAVPTESHSDGLCAGYFPKTLWTLLLALGYSEPPLFIGVLRMLRRNSYLWRVHVIIHERSTTDHICHICHMVEATTPRWTFEGGMSEAAWQIWCYYGTKRGTNGAIIVPPLPEPRLRRS